MRHRIPSGPVRAPRRAAGRGPPRTVAQIDRALPLLDTELPDGVRAFIASSLEGDLEWAAQVHDARTAPRARLEPTWVIYSDWHALFRHIHGVP